MMIRQSGRTSRIINFAIEQLFSIGEVIVTDHVAFEYPKIGKKSILYFVERVVKQMDILSLHTLTVEYSIKKLDDIYVVHFKTKLNDDRGKDKKNS